MILGQRGNLVLQIELKRSFLAVVVDSDQVNSTDFGKLQCLACKMEEENRKTQILMKDIQDALTQIQENQGGGPRGRGRGNGNGRGRGDGRGYDGYNQSDS